MKLDLAGIVSAVEAAMPKAAPFALGPMLAAQLRHLDAPVGRALVERMTTGIPSLAWEFTDAVLDALPPPVVEHALVSIRALPPGRARLHALCDVPRRLSVAEQREALDGILDGTFPKLTFEHGKPLSYDDVITKLVRTLPEAWREEWIATRAKDPFQECLARRAVGSLSEAALRDMWSRIDHASKPTDIPGEYFVIVPYLPPDLMSLALARVRACASESSRLHHLASFDEQLTDAERYQVVEVPWNPYTRNQPRSQADHLRKLARHLPKVPMELRQRWLRTVLAFTEDYDLQLGLMALEPSLSGEDHRQAIDALVASALRVGEFYDYSFSWSQLPEAALPPLLLRLRADEYGWSRDSLIGHIASERSREVADECLYPLADALGELDADHCLEIVRAMTPWLADRSGNAVPRALAELPIPILSRPANPLYASDRLSIPETPE